MALSVPGKRIHEAFSHYYLPNLRLTAANLDEDTEGEFSSAIVAADGTRYHLARLPLGSKSMMDIDAERIVSALRDLAVNMSEAGDAAGRGVGSIPLVSELNLGGNEDLSAASIEAILDQLLRVPAVVLSRLEHVAIAPSVLTAADCTPGSHLHRAVWALVARSPNLRTLVVPTDDGETGCPPLLSAVVELNSYPPALKHATIAAYDNVSDISSVDLSAMLQREDPLGAPRFAAIPEVEGVAPLPLLTLGANAMKALSSGLLENQTLVRIDLGHNRLGDDGAAAIADCLRSNKCLTELSLDQNQIGTKGGMALLQALEGVDADGNRITPSNRTLTELNLNDNNLTDIVAREMLRIVNKRSTTVGYIGLDRNCISPAIFSRLSEELMLSTQPGLLRDLVPSLYTNSADHARVVFNRSEHKLTDASTRVLLHALRGNTVVTHVDLSNNDLSDDSAIFLSQIISQCPVRKLILQHNFFTDAGALKLLDAATQCPTLELLDIRFQDTPISSALLDQVEALVELNRHPSDLTTKALQLVQDSPDVVSLHLDSYDGKRRCTNQTVALLRRILCEQNTHVRELYLGNNAGHLTEHALSDLAVLTPRLTVLDLTNLGLGDAALQVNLFPAFKDRNCTVERFVLDKNPVTDVAIGALVGILRHHNAKMTSVSVEGCKEVTSGARKELDYACGLNTQPPSFKALLLVVETGKDHTLTSISLKATDRTLEKGTSYHLERRYDDTSCALLCRAMESNNIITHIDLTGNDISDASANCLAELVVTNITLTHVNISYSFM